MSKSKKGYSLPILGVSTKEHTMAVAEAKPELAIVTEKGKTRGRYQRDIEYKQLNRIPDDVKQFMAVTGTNEQADLCEYLFEGYNALQYRVASDEIGEFIEDAWDKLTADNFRTTVRGMVKLTGMTVEAVVGMLKPSVQAGFEARLAAEAAAKLAASTSEAATV